jgi:hypothetical protein
MKVKRYIGIKTSLQLKTSLLHSRAKLCRSLALKGVVETPLKLSFNSTAKNSPQL